MAPERSGFVSANMLYMKNKQKTYITTGSKRAIAMMMPPLYTTIYRDLLLELDQILGGGLETLSVTEVHQTETTSCEAESFSVDRSMENLEQEKLNYVIR